MSHFEVIVPRDGEVSLADKQCPIHELQDSWFTDELDLVYTRGKVDITALKEKILSLPAEMWDDENQEGNVKLKRPSHDAWGIKKIVFTFCDDYIMKVLDLPWSRNEEWKNLLSPIYSAIGVDENRIIRSLLASMPPGMTIPVHHDTGYWVKHAHRIHVKCLIQLLTNNTFIFYSFSCVKNRYQSLRAILKLIS